MNRYTLRRHIPMLALVAIVLTLCLTPAIGAAASDTAAPDFAAIDAYVEQELRDLRIPGLALGIVQGDQIVHLKGFGVADPSGRPVTPQTPFMIGSVTKSFTAIAVMQLVEQGKVELDAPIQRYLPWFRVADKAASAQITVRRLLNQTSGLSRATGNQFQASRDMRADALEQQARWLSTARLSQPVGAGFQYSNANWWPLGMLIQTVSGQPYDAYIQQHILEPLGMRRSFTAVADAQAQGLATGYRYWFGRYLPTGPEESGHYRGVLPQGGVISSAEDMAHYLIAHLNQGRYNGKAILSPAGMAEVQRPAVPLGSSADAFYAMGLDVGSIDGVPAVSHDGSMFNFHANLVLIPAGRWGIILLENAENLPDEFGPQRLQGIAAGVTSLLAGRQPPPAASSWFLPILYGAILGIVVAQVLGMLRSVALLRRWRARPADRPRGRVAIGRRVFLPLVSNAIWALIVLVGLPRAFGPLPVLMLGMPDLGPLLVGSGVVALSWGILRTALAYRESRRSRPMNRKAIKHDRENAMNRIISVAKRHPLGTFFGLTFAVTWAAMAPWLRGGGEDIPWFTFGPMLAALIVSALVGGKNSLKALLRRQIHWRVGVGWYAIALGLPIALELATVALNSALGAHAPAWDRMSPWSSILGTVVLYTVLSGPLGEELGWRGFALPRLLERFARSPYGALAASLILGAIHAAWHLPMFLVGEMDVPSILGTIIGAVLMTWLFQHTQGSVLLAVLFHAANQNSGRFLSPLFTGADATQQHWLKLVVWAVAAIIIVLAAGPARLTHRPAMPAKPIGEPLVTS